MTAILKIDMTS